MCCGQKEYEPQEQGKVDKYGQKGAGKLGGRGRCRAKATQSFEGSPKEFHFYPKRSAKSTEVFSAGRPPGVMENQYDMVVEKSSPEPGCLAWDADSAASQYLTSNFSVPQFPPGLYGDKIIPPLQGCL